MGKTSLLRKVERLLGREHLVLRMSAETEDANLFGERLLDILRGHDVLAEELRRWHVEVDVNYAGIRLRRHALDDSSEPTNSDDLFAWAAERARPGKLIVIIDEITVLAGALERGRPGGAMEFLRSFRRPRQELDNVVVILAASIGIHHVVRSPEPLNDLRKVRVGPLAPDDAVFLARCLLLGEDIATSDETAVAEAMAHESDGIPYFLHHLAAAARRAGGVLEPATVQSLRDAALVDPDDPWNLRHYRERLPDYYGINAELAGRVLDMHAILGDPVSVDALEHHLGAYELARRPVRDELVCLLDDLEADHYLVREGNATAFATRILGDAWRALRRL